MDPKQISKQMFDFNKMAFERSFSAMVVMQDQAEKMFGMWLEQNKWFPEEGKKAMGEWVKTYKKVVRISRPRLKMVTRRLKGTWRQRKSKVINND